MKSAHTSVQGLVRYIFIAVILCMAPNLAHADKLDDFVGFYADLEYYAKEANVSLPFTSDQLDEAKKLIQCLDQAGDNDVEIAICIDGFKDTSTGSTISQKSEIPSWVWDLLDCYIYYRTGDWWSLGYKLGEAVVCVVLQVVASGTDICGILEELIDLANAVWDAAKAIGQFFASVGEAAYETVKDVGCALGLGGCDDGPDTPPEAWVYSLVFANRLGEGLDARKAYDNGGLTNPTFDNFVSLLKQNALHKPDPILSVSPPPDVWGFRDAVYSMFTPGPVNKAAEIYTLNVNIQWTNDIAQNVLGARAQKLSGYASPQSLDHLTQLVLSAYTPQVSWNPRQVIINKCTNDLKLEYAHVDRWLTIFPMSLRGPQAEAIAPTVKSNYLLAEAFYEQVKNEIYQRIRAHVIQQYAPDIGGRLVGNTIDKHRSCLELLTPFGRETQCWANTAACGKEARDAILAEFKKKGTQFYGGPVFNPSPIVASMVSYDPLEFLCYRPTHVYYFDFYYEKFYGDLPRKLLESRLQMDGAYKNLKDKVAAAVAQLNDENEYVAYGVDDVDPLMVATADFQSLDDVQQSANQFGFGPPSAKPGFEFSQGPRNISIDGRSTPLLYFDMMGSMKKPLLKMEKPLIQKDLSALNPKDPITNPVYRPEAMGQEVMQAPDQLQQVAPAIKAAPKEVGAGAATQPMSGTLPEGQIVPSGPGIIETPTRMKQVSPTVKTVPKEIKTGETTQPMSGNLPEGKAAPVPVKAAPKSAPAPTVVAQKPVSVPPPVLPDLTADAQLKVNAILTGWGKTVELTTETPSRRVDLEFAIKNSGKGDSPGFAVNCITGRKVLFQKNLNPLKAGAMMAVEASVDLEPGNHLLVLTIDSGGNITESNENNNRYEIRMNISQKPKIELQKKITPAPAVKPMAPIRSR